MYRDRLRTQFVADAPSGSAGSLQPESPAGRYPTRRRIGVMQHAPNSSSRRLPQHDHGRPGGTVELVEQRLHRIGAGGPPARHVASGHRALELEQVTPENRGSANARTPVDHRGLLGLHLDVFASLLAVTCERVHEQVRHEECRTGTGLTHALREVLLRRCRRRDQHRGYQGQHLHGVGHPPLDLFPPTSRLLARQPAARHLTRRSSPRA